MSAPALSSTFWAIQSLAGDTDHTVGIASGSRYSLPAAAAVHRTITISDPPVPGQSGYTVSFCCAAVSAVADWIFVDSGATERGRIVGSGNGGAISFVWIAGTGWRACSWSGDGEPTL